jgi:hypothetical protein
MKDKMADYLFDCLSAPDRDALNEHLGRCPKCAEHFHSLKAERDLLREFAGKVDAGMQARKQRMAEAIKSCDLSVRRKLPSRFRAIVLSPIARVAVAAGLLIAVGFIAGRLLPAGPAEVAELRAAMEGSLRSSLEAGIYSSLIEQVSRDHQAALERQYLRLKDELARQFRLEMHELAEMTLTVSQTATEERLAELIRLIEAARAVDHWQVARAFEQVESNRLRDRTRFGESLVSLAPLKNEITPADPEQK